ncbi:uncharacterized protein BDR25DRAFT_290528 [Lindgomyces ingoldianus]|uniref:Uncharacterized protein n=1 Tax=Lindgomyces ingoldianus TaxID=673940 RepID=A0ACB6QN50_9PLEO|nr:uncharacterized protein BDR25DRAFT_290528 [Lindgomyces ingoldianus]KAF2468399.1 hypothetical protein BDR25DRAFT_290528 [Lindgomyces ingoldianus]
MGQGWMILALRLKEVLNVRGKLGEILFDGSARSLVMLLAQPVPPPGYIQSTAMHSNTENLECGYLSINTVREREHNSDKQFIGQKKGRMQDDRRLNNRDAFSGLPAELLDLVFNDLSIEDVLTLSLVSRYFWGVGEKHIQTYILSPLAPWAGEAIVCVGDDIEQGDYPPGMLTAKEENDLHEYLRNKNLPTNLSSFVDLCAWIRGDVSPSTALLGQLRESEQYHSMSDSDRSQLRNAVWPDLSQLYPYDQPWILRNLTIKAYVRSEAIALEPAHIHGPNIDFIGFGEVILSRTCWSTDSSISMAYEGNIHRGIWAGHCFDITTLGRHRQDAICDEWEDVSEEVAKEIAGIWESEYGSNWRDTISQRKHPRYYY